MVRSKKILLILVAFTSLGLGIFLGNFWQPKVTSAPKPTSQYEKIGVLLKVLNYVENNYVDEVKIQDLIYGAINGMLATLDPHTNFLTPELFKEMKVDTSGQFGGLGIEITIKDGVLTIISPMEGTPAYKAGLQPNDKIVKIEEEYTDKMNLIEAVSKMRGKKGTPVTIYIMREGLKEPKKYTIVRAIIKVQSVKSSLLDKEYAYIRLVNFQERTTEDLKKAIENLTEEAQKDQKKNQKTTGLRGIVLDLRNNPGGLLDQAVGVSDLFLEKGAIVSTLGRHKENKDIEIVVGTKTFGKGSVQQVIELDDKSGLKLTVAKYYTPNGRSIQEKGLEPDIVVEQIDPKVLKEEELKRKGARPSWREADLPKHFKGEQKEEEKGEKEKEGESPEPKKEPLSQEEQIKFDYQLQQALGYLKSYMIFHQAYVPSSQKSASQ
ncbi:MAG: PDZ domain-containing protein [Deltaproteobacteria bacterium]|nr:PDZ domain-containing protein [Deltaproteobacteria bacterium]